MQCTLNVSKDKGTIFSVCLVGLKVLNYDCSSCDRVVFNTILDNYEKM